MSFSKSEKILSEMLSGSEDDICDECSLDDEVCECD